jgi:hypothetical protein
MKAKPKVSWLGLAALAALALAGAALVERPALSPALRPLPELVPAGPLLVLESRDFSSLVSDWNASSEKQAWLESSNYAAFSRSRLYLRLKDAQGEFAAAAGLPPNMSLVESIAGGESALALYDIGKLEFLYVTRMPSTRAVESTLWRARGNYEPREAAGARYYVHVDRASRRVVAFATTGDLLLLATREDLLAGALALATGQKALAVKDEPWFADAVRAAGADGAAPPEGQPDLRLVVDLTHVIRSPYFRSYWIERNVSDLRQYRAMVSDLYRTPTEIREERVLLRPNQNVPAESASGGASGAVRQPTESETLSAREAALGEVLRLAPSDAGLYRAWAAPPADAALELLEEKVLSPHAVAPAASTLAPGVILTSGEVGSENDLETRIDEAPLPSAGAGLAVEPLLKLLEGSKLAAMLEVESSEVAPDRVFVRTPSAIVLLAASDWDGDAVRRSLESTVRNLWTTSGLGVGWVARQSGPVTYYALDGLARLSMATRGRLLVLADSAPQLVAVLARSSRAGSSGAGETRRSVYTARFNHARESVNFLKMVRLMDTPNIQPSQVAGGIGGREPQFFSENIASLSRTLARVESASIAVDDRGPSVSVRVVYRLRK